ncbi:hypothetical protein MO767_18860 [Pseudomonas sp. UYIF39]|uniref:hypothetical protein n=1 Tax=Pseudomonas sp. UYIF39 TaxID=1630747 RepID=UPI00249F7FBE|nr:hypothetical protein [Pseudomonas sp. UYIF39]MDI3356388.1 hypothetical protein [Pseudomonas sp. UYIF39]
MLKPLITVVSAIFISACAAQTPDNTGLSSRGVGKWQAEVVCKKMGADTRDTIMLKLNPGDLPYSQHGLLVLHSRDEKGRNLGFSTYFVQVQTTPFTGAIAVDVNHRIVKNGPDVDTYFQKMAFHDQLKRGEFTGSDSMKLNMCGRVETFHRIPQNTRLDLPPPLEDVDYN